MPPLYNLGPGDRAVVALPGSTDPDVAMFLEGLGVRPGVEVEVREKHPFDGPLVVSVDGKDRTLGEKVARQIMVRVAPQEAAVDGKSMRPGKKVSSTSNTKARKDTV
jgi:Fe2+ transport system protein FeoA